MLTLTAPTSIEARPERIAVTGDTLCKAPGCSLTLNQHPAGSRPAHIDGFAIGSDQCAAVLFAARRPGIRLVCTCGAFAGECQCAALVADARAMFSGRDANRPPIVFRFGGAA